MAAKDLESRLVVVSTENAPAIQSLQNRWLLTTSEVQAARTNGDSRFLLLEKKGGSQIIGSHRLRAKEIIGGNTLAYAVEHGGVVVYVINPQMSPFDAQDFSRIDNTYSRMLSREESQKLRRRGMRIPDNHVARFSLAQYPTSISTQGQDLNYNFFEILGNGSQARVAEMLLFSHLHGITYPNDNFRAYYSHKERGDHGRTRIGLLSKSRVEHLLRNSQDGEMVASFIQVKGVAHSFDVYLGSPPCGYVVSKIPQSEWRRWLSHIDQTYSKPTMQGLSPL